VFNGVGLKSVNSGKYKQFKKAIKWCNGNLNLNHNFF
jgi:hypothetical protein